MPRYAEIDGGKVVNIVRSNGQQPGRTMVEIAPTADVRVGDDYNGSAFSPNAGARTAEAKVAALRNLRDETALLGLLVEALVTVLLAKDVIDATDFSTTTRAQYQRLLALNAIING